MAPGWKTASWTNQAMDFAISRPESTFLGIEFQKPPPEFSGGHSRWIVDQFSSRPDLEAWFQAHVGDRRRYHYLAIFDKLSPEWAAGRPVAVASTEEEAPRVSASTERGQYNTPLRIGAVISGEGCGSSLGTWIIGGLLVGGAVLWAKHQNDQIAKLSAAAGLPHHSFVEDVSTQAKALSETARSKIHRLTAKKGT